MTLGSNHLKLAFLPKCFDILETKLISRLIKVIRNTTMEQMILYMAAITKAFNIKVVTCVENWAFCINGANIKVTCQHETPVVEHNTIHCRACKMSRPPMKHLNYSKSIHCSNNMHRIVTSWVSGLTCLQYLNITPTGLCSCHQGTNG